MSDVIKLNRQWRIGEQLGAGVSRAYMKLNWTPAK